MSFLPWDKAVLIVEYAILALVGIFVLWLTFGRAVELSIVGNMTGHGAALLNYSGESLNVSLTQNGTVWSIIGNGVI